MAQWKFSRFLILALFAFAIALSGCGSDGSDGKDGRDGADFEVGENVYAGATTCLQCHTSEVTDSYLMSKHVVHSTYINQGSDATCLQCHDPRSEGFALERYVSPTNIPMAGLAAVSCEDCHGPSSNHADLPKRYKPEVTNPTHMNCASCHEGQDNHMARHPFAYDITKRYDEGRHTGRARTGNCAACHSHEGALIMFDKGVQFTTVGDIAAISDQLARLESVTSKSCATCHEPHSGNIRGAGDITMNVTAPNTGTGPSGPADRVVYSAEFNLCTACHQVNLDATWNATGGYNGGGVFEYALSDAYLHANDPYGDNSDVGYHSDSYQDRSFFDTHFSGKISKSLYYYDIKDGVEKARQDRNGNLIVTDDMTDAIAMLEAYYAEYQAAPDDIEVTGYNVNPASPNACSACHDVHSANKVEGTAALLKEVGHELMAEPRMQQAIEYGQGVGATHGNYISDAFSREQSSASCMPCHTGRELVYKAERTGYSFDGARWNPLGCVTCHDMVEKGEGHSIVSPRAMAADHEFAFNSGEVVDVADLGASQICFECHKARTGGADVAAMPAQPTNHYDISYLHYSPTFAILFGTDSGMVAEYAGKEYRGKSTTHGGLGCVDCHDVHTNSIRVSNPTVMGGADCASCHSSTGQAPNDWAGRPAKANVSGLAALIVDRVYDMLMDEDDTAYNASLNTFLTALQSKGDTTVGKDMVKNRIKERTIAGGWPTKEIAHAVTTWKVFYYEDKASWAHNRNYAYQMLHDAIESIGGNTAAATAIVARPN
ncbi:hypothetical protein LGV61_12360 [Desulfurispirillum indicum]|uniref:hypothetical protein n=1 Tax=Desulfurispirillum indicum TaxID=936456 RepID=UPI001CFA7E9C|nr:hypothetical protein [Desulfurispirillum indicum]UCZ56505.1 hypothetical protein LGV61_12360 [Desulfurispirillum indicum]